VADNWLILKNAKGEPIAVKLAKSVVLPLGTKINFTHHVVRVGVCLNPPIIASDLAKPLDQLMISSAADNSGKENQEENVIIQKDTVSDGVQDSTDHSLDVFDSISLGLDFTHGFSMARDMKKWFKCSVHPSDTSPGFTLVVSFGRSTFRLTDNTVGLALESVIGGFCGMLRVSSLGERVFSFSVANKHVGFHIVQSRFFDCKNFKCYFHLWGFGGPNWQREFRLWQQ
jgi:hypothetical protein